MTRHHALFLSILASLPAFATADDRGGIDHHDKKLETIVVSADPLGADPNDPAQPIKVLAGAELEDRRASTIGETVGQEVGVQSTNFGPGVGRPIIRGQEGARVQILSGGIAVQDASTVSVDHAVGVEPFLADQIEILKGPATLLYGPGAVGGIVNVIDGRIAERGAEGFSGRAELRGDTGADERAAMVRLDGGTETMAWHLDAHDRSTNDVEAPGLEDGEDRIENSAVEGRGGAIGASFFGERGFVGFSLSRLERLYGIPGHAHHHEDEEHEDEHEDEDEHGGEEEAVRIDLEQTRFDVKGSLMAPMPGFERLNIELADTDYGHVELEGDEIGTRFAVDAVDGRAELVHEALDGWHGVIGLAMTDKSFEAIGEEAFVPPSDTSDFGLFVLERKDFGAVELEFGARYDRTEIETAFADRTFDGTSLSVGAHWDLDEHWHLKAGFDRAERAPTAEELFSDGEHVATGSFELGDASLDSEVANQFEVGVHYEHERFSVDATLWTNRYQDFIYLADTGEFDGELPIRAWTQADADFTGFEVESRIQLADGDAGRFDLRLLADSVDAELDDGSRLPRIAPARFGIGLDWSRGGWRADMLVMDWQRQDETAEFETETPGFTTVDLGVAWALPVAESEWEFFARARNLTNTEARLHTSFLKDEVPLAGRTIQAGIRWYF